LEIDRFAGVGKLIEVVDGALGFLDKDIVGVLTEGFDGEDLARVLSLPLPMLLSDKVNGGFDWNVQEERNQEKASVTKEVCAG
jgi:hypothetical protein